ncbi:MAG: T9SS type A sorting domain-containing protein [Bacteroidia bacterium]|nr:T9SS type A sorting domain-containing protein [Bacteroidia bacterium]MBP9847370.1 T9SS type A sorting domain-containing protein [Saprospiraceae bacterium]
MKSNPVQKTFFFFALVSCLLAQAQAPEIEWQKYYGGHRIEQVTCVQEVFIKGKRTAGYIVAGATNSTNGDFANNHGGYDAWILKLNELGDVEWQKCYGDVDADGVYSIKQTDDGGFIFVGCTNSNDLTFGKYDAWVVRLNSTGDVIWEKTFGGIDHEDFVAIDYSSDGGYYISGHACSPEIIGGLGGDKEIDVWVVKLNAGGDIEWKKTWGGNCHDLTHSIKSTKDGGCIVVGHKQLNEHDNIDNNEESEGWIVKLTKSGKIEWQKNSGVKGYDGFTSVLETDDGNYIIGGTRGFEHLKQKSDFWILKVNKSGNIVWQNIVKEIGNMRLYQQTSDGGFVLAGYNEPDTSSDVCFDHSIKNSAIVKLNSKGKMEWAKVFYSPGNATLGKWVIQTSDGKFVVVSNTHKYNDNYTYKDDAKDIWIKKLSYKQLSTDIQNPDQLQPIQIYPNPTNGVFFIASNINQNARIEVYTITGKQVLTKNISPFEKTEVNLTGQMKGVYFIKVTTIDKVWMNRVVLN